MNELEFRTATQIGVSWPERTIEIIVMPYDQPTTVMHHGRVITEVCERGAYDGIETRPNRVRVNRDHDAQRTVGKAIAFYPNREEGLIAQLKIAGTELGEETLALAAEEILDASAGFSLMQPDGDSWNADRSQRTLKRVWLGHIALTPDPAYEGAKTLAVRHNIANSAVQSSTPNLDQIRSWRLEESFRMLDQRRGRI